MLFSGAFSGAFFCALDCAFFKLKKSQEKARSTKFVLWSVLGVWSFVLFSCAFSGAPF